MVCTPMRMKGLGDSIGFWCESESVPVCLETRSDGKVCMVMSDKLCDWPIAEGYTCDAPMCADHAHNIDFAKDFCHTHVLLYRKFMDENDLEAIVARVVSFRPRT